MGNYKYAVGVWAFGSVSDRFCEMGYQKPRSFIEKIEAAGRVDGLQGVEIHFNGDFDTSSIDETKELIKKNGVEICAINCEIFGNRKFRKGALTSTDEDLRNEAIEIVKGAAEASKELNVELVNIWPGAEGHDYSFQIDFIDHWNKLIDSLKEITEAYPDQRFAIEYKGREPRARSSISTVGKSLMITQEIGAENLGVTLDFGHALQVKENPAESVAVLDRYKKLFHVHMNDNTRDWDDDYMVGSYHLMETIEFFYYLKKCNYDGWISLDITPAREDQEGVVAYCIETMKDIERLVDQLDDSILEEAFQNTNALKSHQMIMEMLIGNKVKV